MKFEYQVKRIKNLETGMYMIDGDQILLQDYLDCEGSQGWELVSFTHTPPLIAYYNLIFKRSIKEYDHYDGGPR